MSCFLKHREKGVMTYFIAGKKPKISRETRVFLLFFVAMAIYYGYRMFALTPWYDELYTYYYFISRGPVYAAIHWPLPNNHVGYSALSACLGIFGSAPVALRGVAYLCSLGSLVLLNRLARKCFSEVTALVCVFVFAGTYLVNQMAVQGRAYALVTLCYLVELNALHSLTVEKKDDKCYYIFFGVSLVVSLWAIPSSLYVVMTVCLIGGFLLLLDKDYKRLLRLIMTSLVSAVCTAVIYGMLWLAIGSNLLTKIPDGPFYQAEHIEVILHAPFQAVSEGLEYMLASPYIQSMSRPAFSAQAEHWLRTLLGIQLAPVWGLAGDVMCVLVAAALLAATVCLCRNPRGRFMEWYFVLTPILLAVTLTIQCKLPYQRVFSFLGVWIAFLFGWLIQQLTSGLSGLFGEEKRGRAKKWMQAVAYLIAGLSWAFVLADDRPYSIREDLLADAYEQITIEETDRIAVTDCDQEYYLLYRYGIGEERVTRQIGEADIVLLDKALLGEQYGYRENPEEWKFYLTKEEVDEKRSRLEENMERVYENWHFILFAEKQARTE